MLLAENPNQTRPTLTLRARPLALAAYRAKIKLVDKSPPAEGAAASPSGRGRGAGQTGNRRVRQVTASS